MIALFNRTRSLFTSTDDAIDPNFVSSLLSVSFVGLQLGVTVLCKQVIHIISRSHEYEWNDEHLSAPLLCAINQSTPAWASPRLIGLDISQQATWKHTTGFPFANQANLYSCNSIFLAWSLNYSLMSHFTSFWKPESTKIKSRNICRRPGNDHFIAMKSHRTQNRGKYLNGGQPHYTKLEWEDRNPNRL